MAAIANWEIVREKKNFSFAFRVNYLCFAMAIFVKIVLLSSFFGRYLTQVGIISGRIRYPASQTINTRDIFPWIQEESFTIIIIDVWHKEAPLVFNGFYWNL